MDCAEGPSKGEEGRADLHGGEDSRKVVEDLQGRQGSGQAGRRRGVELKEAQIWNVVWAPIL